MAIEKLIESWNEDAFAIAPRDLRCYCRALAGRLCKQADLHGQKSNVTAVTLEGLYYAQRGKCAVLGVPLEKKQKNPGQISVNDYPFEIQCDHYPEPVMRGDSMSRVVRGEKTAGGAFAMMHNLQFVSRLGHAVRHFLERRPVDASEIAERLVVQHMNGKPWKIASHITKSLGNINASGQTLEQFVESCVAQYEFLPSTKALMALARDAGFSISRHELWACMTRAGIDLKRYRRENRFCIIRRYFEDNPSVLRDYIDGNVTIKSLHSLINPLFCASGIDGVTCFQFSHDLKVAMQDRRVSVNGDVPPAVTPLFAEFGL